MSNPFESARPAGFDGLVSIPLLDASGAPLLVTDARWRLLDEADEQLQDWVAIPIDPVAPPPALAIVTPAALNTLAPGQAYGMRTVELLVTTAAGQANLSSSYAIESTKKLVPMVNSYGTINQLLTAAQYAPQTEAMHLTGASDEDRLRALLGAYIAIERLPLMVVSEKGDELGWLSKMDAATRTAKVGPSMRAALLQAQLLEAAHSLSLPGDEVTQARMRGMVSMTVGESSQYFGNSRPLEMAVSRAASRALSRYMRRSVKLGRA